jgi:hypothetical protein
MWSPRRNHAGLYFNGYLWIFGGRAREFVDLPEERSVGGIFQPRVQDIPQELGTNKEDSLKIMTMMMLQMLLMMMK